MNLNRIRMQLDHTLNWNTKNILAGWLTGNLNVQIEHHLVPCMPSDNLRYIVGDIQKLCEKHGIEYEEIGLLEALTTNFSILFQIGNQDAVSA